MRVKKFAILVAFALIVVSIAMPVLADDNPNPEPSPSESTSTPFLPLKSLNTFKKRLASSSLTKSTSIALSDTLTREPIWNKNGMRELVPASAIKILTAAIALETFGPNYRFTTKLTWDEATRTLTLVGDADPMLRTDHLRKLIEQLYQTDIDLTEPMIVQADATIFPRHTKPEGWVPNPMPRYVRPVTALYLDNKVTRDPVHDTLAKFLKLLAKSGITVASNREAKATGEVIAEVKGFPLIAHVRTMLQNSENTIAEMLLRRATYQETGKATWAAMQTFALQKLEAIGLYTDDLRIVDGSGLSRSNRVSANHIIVLLGMIADETRLNLNVIERMQLMAVSGQTGTLEERFNSRKTRCAQGRVHAKTGSLSDVSALAGYVTHVNGTEVAFAVLVNNINGWSQGYKVRDQIDFMLAGLAGC
jgi:D-alanyl-D-alanine carboxypeptidase/D-alanyl-D-alanine-endopeptidase (penicillin-binding protein 4)